MVFSHLIWVHILSQHFNQSPTSTSWVLEKARVSWPDGRFKRPRVPLGFCLTKIDCYSRVKIVKRSNFFHRILKQLHSTFEKGNNVDELDGILPLDIGALPFPVLSAV